VNGSRNAPLFPLLALADVHQDRRVLGVQELPRTPSIDLLDGGLRSL
jgi:hypothetical protein